ncbi:DUF4097 family beta strand repeat-containing protein [Streptomyces sp. CB01881]|uniref:DUF4097 family beta strand repeat-containing protein n=1 Tax=Streptomyces sp. CB01881 TaxID=2078691 RepID=UPI000CDC15AB|nr:DUF4097 family beta strand repeat-containing protein [Streptomyces sp. CB01881]AUY51295.1 hypothetical protein C2142_22795 [Streptomyces sp. CB01881]TYC74681.1 hypothetical protein EH183_22770 [Streptomyces sp. CB01881]
MKRVLGAAAITGAVLLGMSGCWAGDDEQRRDVAYGVSGSVRELVIAGHTGGVTVRGGGGAVKVSEHQSFHGEAPRSSHELKDGTLTLTYDCENCGIGYEVDVPAGTKVRVTAETGGVKLAGLAGEVEATVSTGGVEASGLTSPTALLRTGTGGIEASFATAPGKVEARAQTGGVRLKVPAGDAYAVDASAGTGGVDVTVPRQPGAQHSILARTETGGVTVAHG